MQNRDMTINLMWNHVCSSFKDVRLRQQSTRGLNKLKKKKNGLAGAHIKTPKFNCSYVKGFCVLLFPRYFSGILKNNLCQAFYVSQNVWQFCNTKIWLVKTNLCQVGKGARTEHFVAGQTCDYHGEQAVFSFLNYLCTSLSSSFVVCS